MIEGMTMGTIGMDATPATVAGRPLFAGQRGERRIEFICSPEGYTIRADGDDVLRWRPDEVETALEVFLSQIERPAVSHRASRVVASNAPPAVPGDGAAAPPPPPNWCPQASAGCAAVGHDPCHSIPA